MPNIRAVRGRIATVVLGCAVLVLAILAMPVNAPPAGAANQALGHDVGVDYVQLTGPSAVNLSDTNGRFMWVTATVRNLSDHQELVQAGLTIDEPVPDGCSRTVAQFMPGSSARMMSPGSLASVMWRVRFECHPPAAPQVITQTVSVTAIHLDIDGAGPHAGSDANPWNDTATAYRQVLIR